MEYNDLLIIYIMSIVSFALFAWDKHRAAVNKTRVPEFVLLLTSFFGGAFGSLCAMIFFYHKTEHRRFTVCVPVFLFVQLGFDILYRVVLK